MQLNRRHIQDRRLAPEAVNRLMKISSIVRVSPSAVIVFAILLSPLFICGIVGIVTSPINLWKSLLFCALYLFVIYLLCSPVINLQDKHLTYRTLFTKRSINLESVKRVEVVARPAPTLELYISENSVPFSLVIKPFSKNGVKCIINYIHSVSPNAQLSTAVSELQRGNFDSVLRESVTVQNLIRFIAIAGGGALIAALWRAFH